MASELERFRDYARERADWQAGEPRQACKETTIFGAPKPADHANCGGCGCMCHAPTDADRALFARLADEIDGYLARDPDVCQVAAEDDMPLWGEDAEASK